jgi:hypothetical protein
MLQKLRVSETGTLGNEIRLCWPPAANGAEHGDRFIDFCFFSLTKKWLLVRHNQKLLIRGKSVLH